MRSGLLLTECTTPPSLAEGNPDKMAVRIGETITYTCRSGFSASTETATCQDDYSFSPATLTACTGR